jgi:hypothetical protein
MLDVFAMQKTETGYLHIIANKQVDKLRDAVTDSFMYLLIADEVRITRRNNKILLVLRKEHVTNLIRKNGLHKTVEKALEITSKRNCRGFLNQMPSYTFEFIK